MIIQLKNIILFSGLLLSSCLFKSENQNTMSEDKELLSKIVNLDPLPKNVQWEEHQKGDNEFGPADYEIYAVLDYSNLVNEEFLALLSNVESNDEISNSSKELLLRNWMSKELKAKIADCKNWDCKSYVASNYYRSAFLHGYFISFLSEKIIVLKVHTS